MHLQIKDVKVTFFTYPYNIKPELSFETICRMPNLLTLSAMKVFALGGRAKWKDYVDLYFILKSFYNIDKIISKAENIYGGLFSSKLLRQQLSYFKDIDYSEEVDFIGKKIPQEEIKIFLVDVATEKF